MSKREDFPSFAAFAEHLSALDRLMHDDAELVKVLGPGMVCEAQGLCVAFRQRFNDPAEHAPSLPLPFPPA